MCRSLVCLFAFTTLLSILPGGATAQAPDEPAGLTVELVDAGETPRRALRFTPKAGDKQVAVMTMNMNQTMIIGGNRAPTPKLPGQAITMEVEITEVSQEGDIHFGYTYTDVDVIDDPNNPSPAADTIRGILKPLIGATGSGIVTDRGVTKKGEFNIPENLAPQIKSMLSGMKDAMNRLSAPVPAEPVGVGASWRVTTDLNANGMQLKQTAVYELTKLDDDGFATSVTVSQKADPQQVNNPDLPPGTVVKLSSLKGSGKGTSEMNQNEVLPRNSTVSVDTEISMNVSAQGQETSIAIDQNMEMVLSPKK